VTVVLEVDRVDHLVIPVLLVAIEVLRLPTVTGIVKEKRVV